MIYISNDDYQGLSGYLDEEGVWKELKNITAKEMQLTLKAAMKKVDTQSFDYRLGFMGYDKDQLTKFRNQCKNLKLRHIYFRLVSRENI